MSSHKVILWCSFVICHLACNNKKNQSVLKCFICSGIFADWYLKIASDIIFKGMGSSSRKLNVLHFFVKSNFKRGFLAAALAHRWPRQIRLFPVWG